MNMFSSPRTCTSSLTNALYKPAHNIHWVMEGPTSDPFAGIYSNTELSSLLKQMYLQHNLELTRYYGLYAIPSQTARRFGVPKPVEQLMKKNLVCGIKLGAYLLALYAEPDMPAKLAQHKKWGDNLFYFELEFSNTPL